MKLMIDLNTFYSSGDERRFFDGLSGNAAVSGFRGIARQLEVTIIQSRLNRDQLWDLIALFRRYQIQLAPLAPLSAKKKFAWLADQQWAWHQSMFAAGTEG